MGFIHKRVTTFTEYVHIAYIYVYARRCIVAMHAFSAWGVGCTAFITYQVVKKKKAVSTVPAPVLELEYRHHTSRMRNSAGLVNSAADGPLNQTVRKYSPPKLYSHPYNLTLTRFSTVGL